MGPNREDIKDRKQTTLLVLILALLILAVTVTLVLVVGPYVLEATSAGLGLKESAVISFVVTLVLIIILAVVAGDGLLGEIQFMISGFLGFFVTIWLAIAWIF